MKKRVLVCGATGFIGRNIAEALAKRDDLEVYGTYFQSKPFENPNIKLISANLHNKEEVDNVVKEKDVIIQAAATTSGSKDTITKPYIHVTDNAIINSLIFRSAFENKVSHVVFFSCSVMYQPSDVPIKETDFDPNKEIYKSYFGVGWTKVYIEKMCEFYSRLGTKYTVLRHSNIYGPYDKYDLDRSHVFGATITKVMTAPNGGNIVVWGTGEEERDLLYVEDIARFVELAIEKQKEPFNLVNVGYNSSISVARLVQKIINASEKDLKIVYDPTKPTIKTKVALDSTKAKELFGWTPKVSLDEGIRRTIAWYREHILQTMVPAR